MTESEFPFRSFTLRSEGYDRAEVDSYVEELRSEIVELRRALETATPSGDAEADIRLHDPEGAVTRTLAIAQETADRVLHDAQVEADRRRSEADEHSTSVIAEADERASRMLGEMEAQAAEVREQGVAAARSAIQVERDKAMAELAHVRRVRDDLRTEAVDLKTSLDTYRSQAREASDTLAAASSGPLMSVDLPDFIDDEVLLAGITPVEAADASDDGSHLRAVETAAIEAEEVDGPTETPDDGRGAPPVWVEPDDEAEQLAPVIALDTETELTPAEPEIGEQEPVASEAAELADDSEGDEGDEDGLGGTFLAEVRAAAEDDDVALPPENDESDSFLSELRGITSDSDDGIDSEAADTFFDDQN